jgi:hypothetical protein
MDYSRNHSRALSSGRRYYGDEPVYVDCVICRDRQPADGVHAVRARTERGVKARIGYRGPSRVWVCRTCAVSYGTVFTHDIVGELAHDANSWREPPEVELPVEGCADPSFWKWALVGGAAIIFGAVLLA